MTPVYRHAGQRPHRWWCDPWVPGVLLVAAVGVLVWEVIVWAT